MAPPVERRFSAAEVPPIVTTREQLAAVVTKAEGTGTLVSAVTAPQTGDIPVKPGTPVVLVAKHLRDTDTFKKLVRVVQIAWAAFAAFVGYKIIDHGSVWGMDWTAVARGAVDAALLSALAVYGISLKAKFNDPSVSASWAGSAKADAADVAAKGLGLK